MPARDEDNRVGKLAVVDLLGECGCDLVEPLSRHADLLGSRPSLTETGVFA